MPKEERQAIKKSIGMGPDGSKKWEEIKRGK